MQAGLAGLFHGALGGRGVPMGAPNPDCGFRSALLASLCPIPITFRLGLWRRNKKELSAHLF